MRWYRGTVELRPVPAKNSGRGVAHTFDLLEGRHDPLPSSWSRLSCGPSKGNGSGARLSASRHRCHENDSALTRSRHRVRCESRQVRDELGASQVSTHSFRKTVATLIDDQGLSARIGAGHLGHAKVSMTQDRYMARGKLHPQVAELLERAISDE
jgi:integrase